MRPKFTVSYNVISGIRNPLVRQWIGTGKEFFENREDAEQRGAEIPAEPPTPSYRGPVCATVRPYSHNNDARFLGGAHVFEIEKPF